MFVFTANKAAYFLVSVFLKYNHQYIGSHAVSLGIMPYDHKRKEKGSVCIYFHEKPDRNEFSDVDENMIIFTSVGN